MKKIMALLLAVLTLIAFVACDTGNGSSSPVGTGTESETGPGTGSTGSEGGNTGSGSTGGNGSSSTGGSGSGSTEEKSPYVGTWTGNVTIEGQACSLSATLNDDETLVAYLSMEGFTDGTWSETDSGVSLTIGKETVPGKLNNGNLVVNYGQDIPLTKVDTTAYVGTWKGTLGGATLSIKLNADGTMSGYSPVMNPTSIDGFWTGTNDGVMIGADVGDEDPEEGIIPGSLQGDKLVINFKGQIELTKDSSSSDDEGGSSDSEEIGVNEPGKVINLREKSSPKAQYTLPVNLPNLKIGDIVELKMKGTSDRVIRNLYIKFVDDDSHFLWLADEYFTEVDDEFDIMWSYEVTTLPISSGKKRTCFNFMDIAYPTPATLTCEEFIIDVVDKTTFEGRWVTKETDGEDNYWIVIDDNKVTVGTDDYDDWPESFGTHDCEINGSTFTISEMNITGTMDNGKFTISDPGNSGRNITFIKVSNRTELPSETTIRSNYMNQSYYDMPSSTVDPADYVGTWTVTMEDQVLCITLNADGTCVAYNSDEGFAEAIWNVTSSGVTITIPGEGSLSGRLDNGNLVVNYGQDVPLTKVDTAAYVGTWKGTLGGATLSITLNADGTMSGYSPIMEPTNIDGFWTVTNDGVIIGADVGDEDPEEGIIPGSLQGDKLVINFNGQIELTKE